MRAPADTRFTIGTSPEVSVDCETKIRKAGGPTEYHLLCPRSGSREQLFSITTIGDYDYTFSKPLP